MLRAFSRGCQLVVVAIVLLAFWQLPQLKINSNLLALFPSDPQAEAENLAEQSLTQKYERQVLLLLTAREPEKLRANLSTIAENLQACDCIAWAGAQQKSTESGDTLGDIYAYHANAIISQTWRDRLMQESPERIQQQRLRELLTSPGALNATTLANDPLGSLQDFVRSLNPLPPAIKLDRHGNPYVIIDSQKYYLLRIELSESAFSLSTQTQFAQTLDRSLAGARNLPGFNQLQTGAIFYTMAGTEQARKEISTVGLGSALGIVFLLLLVFRRAELLLLAFAPIAVGVAVGFVVTQWVFGQVHVMALVFGAALVGVAIDYSVHFFAKRLETGAHWQARDGARRLFAPLSLGLVSSCAGYLSFVLSGFPGFMQIAVLSSTGLVAAYCFVMGWYPILLARPSQRSMPRWLVATLDAVIVAQGRLMRQLKRPVVYLSVVAFLLCGFSFWQVNDNIRTMQSIDPELQKAEQTLREHIAGQPSLQYFLVQAADADTLLRRTEAMRERLDTLVAEQKLGGYNALFQWLPSLQRQRENVDLWRQQLLENGVLARLYQKLGVRPEQMQAYLARWDTQSYLPPDATLPKLAGLPGAPGYFVLDGSHFGVVQLFPPFDSGAMAILADEHRYWQWVDPVARTSELLKTYRQRASLLLLVAYSVIFFILFCRYGALGALRVVAPPALASALALAMVLLVGQAISVFHMMALLLVLGVGVDYSLFWRESARKNRATMLAIGLSTLTTVLSFGLLSLSSTAAIHNFGLVVLTGILLVFLLAPLSLTKSSSRYSLSRE